MTADTRSGERSLLADRLGVTDRRPAVPLPAVVAAAGPAPVKVILEVGRLDRERKIAGARIAVTAGAAFVKTSTGTSGGATIDDVRLLRETVGRAAGVKASGGIRTLGQALALIEAGADRLGTSAGVTIVREASA